MDLLKSHCGFFYLPGSLGLGRGRIVIATSQFFEMIGLNLSIAIMLIFFIFNDFCLPGEAARSYVLGITGVFLSC